MDRRARRAWWIVAVAAIAALAWWRPWRAQPARTGGATTTATAIATTTAIATATATAMATASATATSSAPHTYATMRWGSGPRDLGRKRPQEGNPEGPMSFALAPGGDALVLDQVNGRLVRFGPDGAPRGSLRVGDGAQDVAIGGDGTVAVLDRLVDRSVTLYGADGRSLGALPLDVKGLAESGQVTGVFVDGTSVYVEREHGQLVRVGDTKGGVGGGDELPGRPTRDGSSFVSAFLETGRAFVSATTRATLQHRYTRAVTVPGPARGILLLDTDRYSTVYVAVLGGAGDGTDAEWLACVALEDGRVLGVVPVTPNTLPEETFREFAVLEDGGVLHAELGEDGVTYVRYDCR